MSLNTPQIPLGCICELSTLHIFLGFSFRLNFGPRLLLDWGNTISRRLSKLLLQLSRLMLLQLSLLQLCQASIQLIHLQAQPTY